MFDIIEEIALDPFDRLSEPRNLPPEALRERLRATFRGSEVLGDLLKRLDALSDLLRVRFTMEWPMIVLSVGPAGCGIRVERTGWWLQKWSYVGQPPSWRHGSAGLGLLRVFW